MDRPRGGEEVVAPVLVRPPLARRVVASIAIDESEVRLVDEFGRLDRLRRAPASQPRRRELPELHIHGLEERIRSPVGADGDLLEEQGDSVGGRARATVHGTRSARAAEGEGARTKRIDQPGSDKRRRASS
jgi:hypothetical protein